MPFARGARPRSASTRPPGPGPREDDVYIDLTCPTTSTRPEISLPSPSLHLAPAPPHRQQQILPPILPSSSSFTFEPRQDYHFDPYHPLLGFSDSDPSLADRSIILPPGTSGGGGGVGGSSNSSRRHSDRDERAVFAALERLNAQSINGSGSDPDGGEQLYFSRTTTPQVRTRPAEDTGGRQGKRRRVSPSVSATPGPSASASSAGKRLRAPAIPVGDVEEIDLIGDNDDDVASIQGQVQEEMVRSQDRPSGRRRIADFKCVICLDEPTELSATTCGHLFCSDCIKTTLRYNQPNPAAVKSGKCPVCRGKVNLKEIVTLELKLRKTTSGKGKERARG